MLVKRHETNIKEMKIITIRNWKSPGTLCAQKGYFEDLQKRVLFELNIKSEKTGSTGVFPESIIKSSQNETKNCDIVYNTLNIIWYNTQNEHPVFWPPFVTWIRTSIESFYKQVVLRHEENTEINLL